MTVNLLNPIQKSKRVIHLERELTILNMPMALRALETVRNEMSTGKFIRHDKSPYYLHCVDVTLHLINMGFREGCEDLLTASLLHDYAEDVPDVTIKLIADLFNPEVAKIVQKVTKKPNVDYHTDLEEKKRYFIGILEDERATLLKISDRLCNFTTMRNSSLEHRIRQVKETKNWYLDFLEIARKTHVKYESYFYTAELTIKALIGEYERYFEDIEEKNLIIANLTEQLNHQK